MIKHIKNHKRGIVALIVIIVIAVIILGYFGFDLQRIFESPQVRENLIFLWELIKVPFMWLFNFITSLIDQLKTYIEGLLQGNSDILDPNR